MVYDIGDVARLSVEFKDVAGVLTDPTVVTLTVQAPSNVQSTPTPIRDSAGKYHYDLPVTQSGVYFYRYVGTGAVSAVEEGQISVRSTTLVPQPPAVPAAVTSFTSYDLQALTIAIKTGAKQVHFQDRTVTYHSLEDMLKLRAAMISEIGPASSVNRQIRMQTSSGL